MPAPRIAFEEDGPQLPTISAPCGLPFLSKGEAGGSNEPGLGQNERD
jgi:hypothetical protein